VVARVTGGAAVGSGLPALTAPGVDLDANPVVGAAGVARSVVVGATCSSLYGLGVEQADALVDRCPQRIALRQGIHAVARAGAQLVAEGRHNVPLRVGEAVARVLADEAVVARIGGVSHGGPAGLQNSCHSGYRQTSLLKSQARPAAAHSSVCPATVTGAQGEPSRHSPASPQKFEGAGD